MRATAVDVRLARNLGSVYTPSAYAQFLTNWAIQGANDKVLDIGTGNGVFVFEAYRKLLQLGATPSAAQDQVYGAEIDASSFDEFIAGAQKQGLRFPNVFHSDFFSIQFPSVNAVVGNPPYVRRTYISNIDHIRQRVLSSNRHVTESDLPRLSDLYIYFLLQALEALLPGGRCAVIMADPWMTAGYGRGFKRYLQQCFDLECLISLDRRVFEEAQVKPVLLLATKRRDARPATGHMYFLRVKNGMPIGDLTSWLEEPNTSLHDVVQSRVERAQLTPEHPWSVHLRAPEIRDIINAHPLMTPVATIADTRIGIQTLAKDFFVLTSERALKASIEPEFLAALAQSSRIFNRAVIDPGMSPEYLLFYCSKSKSELEGTRALAHILEGEASKVSVRGKDAEVIGYHNKERIQHSHRRYWYDLKSALERRGRATILIPRLVYRKYVIVWNQAQFVPGELFIEFLPRPILKTEDEVYLAVLTSSMAEFMFRIHAPVYGGGTYNISPGQVKRVSILNVSLLSEHQKTKLKQAYLQYVRDPRHSRAEIDHAVFEILGLDKQTQYKLHEALQDLVQLAAITKGSGKKNGKRIKQ